MDHSAANLLTALKMRREYCRALLELAIRQDEFVGNDDHSELLQLIAQKQRVLNRMQELSQPFGNLTAYWQRARETLASDFRTECERVIAESESLLAQVLERERTGISVLVQRRDQTQQQLRELGEFASLRPHLSRSAPVSQFLDVSR